MTTAIAEQVGLCANDIKAMKLADSVSFHYNGENSTNGHEHGSKIVCTKRVRNPGPYEENEKRWEFTVESEFPHCRDGKPRSCFEMIYGYDTVWETITNIVKIGDKLTLSWRKNAFRSGYLADAKVMRQDSPGYNMDLHADALYIHVRRGDKKMVFLLDVSICVDNSARMIRF